MRGLLLLILGLAIAGCGGPSPGASVEDVGICLRDSGYTVSIDDEPGDAGASGRLVVQKGDDSGYVVFYGSDKDAADYAREISKGKKPPQVKRVGSLVIQSESHSDDIADCIDL